MFQETNRFLKVEEEERRGRAEERKSRGEEEQLLGKDKREVVE